MMKMMTMYMMNNNGNMWDNMKMTIMDTNNNNNKNKKKPKII